MTLKLQAEEELFGAAKRMARIMGGDFVLNEQGKALVEARAKELESRTLPLDGDVVERLRDALDAMLTMYGPPGTLRDTLECPDGHPITKARKALADTTRSGDGELHKLCAEVEADAVSGLRYIEKRYGRLDGVGWDRVFNAHDELFRKGAALSSIRDR